MPYNIDLIDDTITDDEIERLLQNAEKRLKAGQIGLFQQADAHTIDHNTQLRTGKLPKLYITMRGGVARADSSRLLSENDRSQATKVRRVEDPVQLKAEVAKEKEATAGADWFNLPRTDLTPELKRDLQLLKMRNVLDPKRHYIKDTGNTKAPEYSQVGTIIEGPTEYYSSRIPNRERKKTFVDEVLAAEETSGRFKSKYNDIQSSKTSGKRAYYKKLKDKRSSGIRKR